MGTVILADITELETIKISELTEATSMTETDVAPIVQSSVTKKITRPNALQGAAVITSKPTIGQYRITGLRLDADKKIVVVYDETPIA